MAGLGTGSGTTNANTTSTTAPYVPAQPNVQTDINQGAGLTAQGPTLENSPEENNIWTMMGNSPGNSAGYSGVLSGPAGENVGNTAANMGNLFDTGDPYNLLSPALSAYNKTVSPIANMNPDPTQNPATESLMQTIQDQIQSNQDAQFAGAGRSLSGMNSKADATAFTNAMAPYLFNQYNTNLSNIQNASSGLLSGAQTTSGAMGNNATTGISLGTAAPTIAETVPTLLQNAAQAPTVDPAQILAAMENLTVPIAGLGGTSAGTLAGNTTTTASPLADLTSVGNLLGKLI